MTTLERKLAQLSPERRARIETDAEKLMEEERALQSLRKARRLTQACLATLMNADQARISKIESSSDLLLSTLRSYVEAMGGSLKLQATFPDGQVEFETLSSALDLDDVNGRADAAKRKRGSKRASLASVR